MDGIVYLHDNKVLHRDITLENLLITRLDKYGEIQEVKLTDYGLAAHCSGNKSLRGAVG